MAEQRKSTPSDQLEPDPSAADLYAMADHAAHVNAAEWKRAMFRDILAVCKMRARAGQFSATFHATPCPDTRHAQTDSCYDELRVFVGWRIHGARISGTHDEVTVSWDPPRGPTFTIAPPPHDSDAPATLPIPK